MHIGPSAPPRNRGVSLKTISLTNCSRPRNTKERRFCSCPRRASALRSDQMVSRASMAALAFPLACLVLSSCAKKHRLAVSPPAPAPARSSETGWASWYGHPYHGRAAANGEIYDMEKLTAAHRTLPFGTSVRVTNLGNGKSVDVRIIDRGPFVAGRIIDLSHAAAEVIEMIGPGVAQVRVDTLSLPALAPRRKTGTRSRPARFKIRIAPSACAPRSSATTAPPALYCAEGIQSCGAFWSERSILRAPPMPSRNECGKKPDPASWCGWMSPCPRWPGLPSQAHVNKDRVFAPGAPSGSNLPVLLPSPQ